MKIQPNGLYHFITEMPGDESLNDWGPDPEPHIHFDIECTGCAAGHGVVDGDYKYWNKFYPEGLCTIDGCGTQVGLLLFCALLLLALCGRALLCMNECFCQAFENVVPSLYCIASVTYLMLPKCCGSRGKRVHGL